MSTTFFDVEVIFQTALDGISGKPGIDFEGQKPYQPQLGTRYWRTNHQPSVSTQVTADGIKQHTGVYQVDIICPTNKGLKKIMIKCLLYLTL